MSTSAHHCRYESAYIWLDWVISYFRCPQSRIGKDRRREEFTVFYRSVCGGGEAQEAFRIPHRVKEIKEVSPTEFLFTAAYNPRVRSLVGPASRNRMRS